MEETEMTDEELRAQIAAFRGSAKQSNGEAAVTPPPAPQPTMMDYLVAINQKLNALTAEVAALRQEHQALMPVVDATGQAVGWLYQNAQVTENSSQQPEVPQTSAPAMDFDPGSYSERFAKSTDDLDY